MEGGGEVWREGDTVRMLTRRAVFNTGIWLTIINSF